MYNVSIKKILCGLNLKKKWYNKRFWITVQQVEGLSGGEEGGTYFVDQAGQYYYQASGEDAPVMTQVQIQEVDDTDAQTEGEVVSEDQYHEIEELENVEGDEEVRRFRPYKMI